MNRRTKTLMELLTYSDGTVIIPELYDVPTVIRYCGNPIIYVNNEWVIFEECEWCRMKGTPIEGLYGNYVCPHCGGWI